MDALQAQQRRADQKVAQLLMTIDDDEAYSETVRIARRRTRKAKHLAMEGQRVSSIPTPPSSTLPTAPAKPYDPMPSPLFEARRLIPFLHAYTLPATFAVPNFRYPIVACTFESVDSRPPVIVYANEAMAQLTEYTSDELTGAPVTTIRIMSETSHQFMSANLANKEPMSVSPVYRVKPLFKGRSGKLWRSTDNSQFFFDQQGNVKHVIVCLLSWEEGHMRECERLGWWPLPKA